jgi:hypothetical protein
MKLINRNHLEDLLLQNWTKFIDSQALTFLIINNIPLYANNWSVIIPVRKYSTKKIHISKTEFIHPNKILFWASFEIEKNNKFYVGTLEILAALDGTYVINNASGVIYQTTDN